MLTIENVAHSNGDPLRHVSRYAACLHVQLGMQAVCFLDESSALDQSVDVRGISLAAAAGEMKALGYRVFAAGAQGLATQQTPGRQQAAAPRAEARNGNPCIIRATGVESAALPEQWAEPALVQMQQPQYQSGQDSHVAGTACSM